MSSSGSDVYIKRQIQSGTPVTHTLLQTTAKQSSAHRQPRGLRDRTEAVQQQQQQLE